MRFKETWHRATVLNLDNIPKTVDIMLIDSLIEVKAVPIEDIRKIPKTLAQQIYTQLCHVDATDEEIKSSIFQERIDRSNVIVNVHISDDYRPILKFN